MEQENSQEIGLHMGENLRQHPFGRTNIKSSYYIFIYLFTNTLNIKRISYEC